MPGKRLFIDYNKCIGCETCEQVCKFAHGRPRIHMTRTVKGVMAPLYCQHCDNPQCLKACPQQAIYRDLDGGVILDRGRCVDCVSRDCVVACPFGAIFLTGSKAGAIEPAVKCDMCAGRRAAGMNPACVEMCPCEAIHYIDRDKVKELQTPEAAAAFKRVIDHLKPPKPAPGK